MSDTGGPRALIYRDQLLPFSETFIVNQAAAMRRYTPVFAGRHRVPGIDLAGRETVVVDAGGARGALRWAGCLAGRPPADFLARLRALQPRLIHAHFGPDGVNALPLQRRLDLPLVVTFHGYDATQRAVLRNGPLAWRYGRLRPRLARRAAALLAVSEHIRAAMLAVGIPAERIRVHRIGVDLDEFTPAPLSARQPIVLGAGRFVEKKGFEFLIDAMSEVQRVAPQAELVLIGSGELEPQLRARAAAKLSSFRIFGPCPPAEITEWMRRARVLAAPSVVDRTGNTEGLPITIVEALASGLPVVATRHAGIPEAVLDGETGYLVGERDPAALAARILDLLGDDSRWQSIGAAARARAEAEFDLATQTARLERIYDEASA